ncbi:hypothetical protein DBR17_02875 [Sphingomonas sp. HMWF008]|nr:hypothetical protein DBR17_02875 [Sphingomonas sp. HMWF008]
MSQGDVTDIFGLARKLARDEALQRARHVQTRGLLRVDLAHWELAELFALCLPLALQDIQRGADFSKMREQWVSEIGPGIEPHLPSLFLAAAASTAVDPDDQLTLLNTVELYRG